MRVLMLNAFHWLKGGVERTMFDESTWLERAGHEVVYDLSGGAADANAFNEAGLSVVNLANGMADIHTPNEHIAVADLEAMVDVTLALVEVALA